MTIAHFGIGVFIAGVTASSAWQVEKVQLVRPGDTVDVAGYAFTFEGAVEAQGPNYVERRGTFVVTRNGRPVTTMHPSKKFYPVQQQATTDAAIHTFWIADLYATISDPDEGKQEGGSPAFPSRADGAWAARLYYNPLVPFIWIGAVIMAFGGIASLTDRRHRIGAPVPARTRPAPAPAAAE
jgi:cytochrome c-type biogenesis protein CcmF